MGVCVELVEELVAELFCSSYCFGGGSADMVRGGGLLYLSWLGE